LIQRAYLGIMELFKADGFWFQQDGASPHVSGVTRRFLLVRFPHVIPQEDWPANSPDLNPIENLWGIINSKVQEHDHTTVRGLRQAIFEEWNAIPPAICQSLVASMPRRLQQCIDLEGAWVDY